MNTIENFTPVQRPPLTGLFAQKLRERSKGEDLGGNLAGTQALVRSLLEDAVAAEATDIHFDPTQEGYSVRFRIDGVVVEATQVDGPEGRRIIRSCKTYASMDPAPAFVPVDGRAEYDLGARKLSVRVALAPTVRGEKMALRLPREELARLSLTQVGLSVPDFELLRQAVEDAQGMILVSGPTGSGKTTTLYALLELIRSQHGSVVTIEDPVEMILPGVTQIQVNEKQGLTFAEGVRGILRLDPDVIFMGEMRDHDSARAALEAADSGHLFLSSLHARDAAGTITSLRNYGLKDHEIAATVDLVAAQRLVRRLCRACRKQEPPTPREIEWLEMFRQPIPKLTWHAKGCEHCHGTGYRGRTGVFEVWRLHEEDADAILGHADEHAIRRRLRKDGTHSLLEDDLVKVAEGITSLEEMWNMGGLGFYSKPSLGGR
jgi:type II secretory ATPase GspE/PulE/Tfp pilus assembly ATPase PilB-like protein